MSRSFLQMNKCRYNKGITGTPSSQEALNLRPNNSEIAVEDEMIHDIVATSLAHYFSDASSVSSQKTYGNALQV